MNRPTSTDRLERDLSAWLALTAQPRTPSYIDDLLAQAARTSQRPAWLISERWLAMSSATPARRALGSLPWRTLGLLVLLAMLLIAGIVLATGSRPRPLPAPYGVASNGVVAVEEHGDIVMVDPVSGTRTVAVGGPETDRLPKFSLDGTRLAFIRKAGQAAELWVADTDGGHPLRLSTDGMAGSTGFEWSPDGRSILTTAMVAGVTSIWIIPTDGGDAHAIDVGMFPESPRWRPPDGREILFRGLLPNGNGTGLYAVRPDGTGLRTIVSPGPGLYDAAFPGWSPDGTRVAFQWHADGAIDGAPGHVDVVPAEGGQPVSITTDTTGADWSPDGARIAALDWSSGSGTWSVVPADGSGPPIQTGPSGCGSHGSCPAIWAPDGTKLLLQPQSGGPTMLLDPAGGATVATEFSTEGGMDWQRLAP